MYQKIGCNLLDYGYVVITRKTFLCSLHGRLCVCSLVIQTQKQSKERFWHRLTVKLHPTNPNEKRSSSERPICMSSFFPSDDGV
jgi:hypothetical protein